MPTDDDADELDAAFEVLADGRRRAVIEVLRTAPQGSLELPDLVEAVGQTCDEDPGVVASSLYHQHLPKLADIGVVEYDLDAKTIEYAPNPFVERCLDVAQIHRSGNWVTRSTPTD